MVASVARLVAITCAVLTLTVLAVLFVRWVGSHQEFQTPPHAWFAKDRWNIAVPALERLCGAEGLAPTADIVMVTVRFQEGNWIVPCTSPMPVTDVLARSKHTDWLLHIEANDTPHLDELVEKLSAFDKEKRIAVHAPAQKVARYLRTKAPQWLFAADAASLLRLHLFESLYLESAMDFWPDFVIASTNRNDGSRLSEREVSELHRRNKRVLWNATEKAPFPVDGELTARP